MKISNSSMPEPYKIVSKRPKHNIHINYVWAFFLFLIY